MDADRGGDAPVEAPLADRTNAGAGPGKRPAGWVPSFGRVGQKRPLAEGRGGAAEPDRDGGDDEPSGDALYDDDDEAVPLSVAELYHEDDEDAPEIGEANKNTGHPASFAASNDAHQTEECPVCPVCALRLADVADTALARVAHVNACLDGAMDGVMPVETNDGTFDRTFGRGGGVDPREFDPESAFVWHEGGEGEWHDVAAWAHAVDAPPAFAEAIVRRRVTFVGLARLSDADLREMGVDTLGARKRLAAAIAERATPPAPPTETDEESAAPAAKNLRSAGWHPTRVASAVAPVFRRAAEGGSSASRRVSNTEASRQRLPEPALFFGRNKKRVAETADANASSSRPTGSRYVPATSPDPPPPPPWIRVPGTRFIVDGFQGYGKSHSRWCTNWFLTHFHADHYKGLTKKTPDPRRCVIWCSRPTAELCRSRLGIQKERLRVVDVGRSFQVEGVSVRFVDANHCPGAVMIVFDGIPKSVCRGVSSDVKSDADETSTRTDATDTDTVLATGDFRFHAGMTSCPILREVARKKPAVMLDTTYCDPKHLFPPQAEVLKAVRAAVRAEAHNASRTLFLFGTYTIGKERVFFEAARALGPDTKIYVGKQKRLVLEALAKASAVPEEDMRRVTSDDTSTNLHVVPMGSVTFERMKTIARYYKNRYDTVVAFKPTGWTFSSARKQLSHTKRTKHGALIQYAVPYSEHSSFKELREFVRFLKPRAILPHVGNDRGENAARMVRALTGDDEA